MRLSYIQESKIPSEYFLILIQFVAFSLFLFYLAYMVFFYYNFKECIWNPVSRLRWSFLLKLLVAGGC